MVMKEVASYCDRQTVPNKSIPLPGAACCAQFTGSVPHLTDSLSINNSSKNNLGNTSVLNSNV